jgi:prophage DNA circulation protein
MTWADNLLPASFRAIEFDILSTEDEARRALARHSYPYTDGADVEDMGLEERKLSVKAIFYGDDYEERLQAFVAALDQRGAGDLVHPVFGAMDSMQVNTYRVSHDEDKPDQCQVSVEFEQSVTAAPFFARALASQAADSIDDAADSVEDASAAALTAECGKVNGLSAAGAMDALSRVGAMREQAVTFLLTLNNQVHGVLTSITDPIANVMGFISDVTALTQALVDDVPKQMEYLRNLASGTRNAVDRLLPVGSTSSVSALASYKSNGVPSVANAAFGRIDQLLATASLQPVVASQNNAPGSYSAWVAAAAGTGAAGVQGAAASIPASSIYPVSAAQSLADTQVLLVHIGVTRAVLKARVAAMVMASEAVTPLSTPHQVEQLVTVVRAGINDAITQTRTRYGVEQARAITEPLKSLALTVQESGRATINARPPMIVRSVESPAPLRLLAHLWYGSHTRALELQRLNNLRRPNAINAGDKINAYAK